MNPKRLSTNSRAFAFTADIALSTLLVIALLVFISLPTQPTPKLEERRITDQFVDDLFVAFDHSGYVANEIDVNGFSNSTIQNVYARAKTLLPSSYDLFLQMKSYPVDLTNCRNDQDFESCFPDANVSTLTTGTPLPLNAPFVHGRRIFIKQQPASQCTSSLSPAPNEGPFSLYPFLPSATFQSSPDVNVQFDVNVNPAGPWTCDQNIAVTLSVSTGSGTRKPVDMMLVFDRSGSMSYDYIVNTTAALGVDVLGNYAYVADSTSGLRDINILDPASPNLLGTLNTQGTSRDVAASPASSHVFVADGTYGVVVVNVTNPALPAQLSRSALGGESYGVDSNGNATFAVVYNGGADSDVSVTGTASNLLQIGRNTSNTYAGQSFIPFVSYVSGAQVRVRKVGNPSGNLSVNIRSSLTGANLGTATILNSTITTSYQYLNVTFSPLIPLTVGSTYYMVLTTPTNNSSNYYEWAGSSGNQYSGGQAFQNASGQSWDARFETHFISGLVKINTTTKSSPVVMGAVDLTDPWRVLVSGNTAYVADGSAGLKIFNVEGSTPTPIGSLDTSGTASDVSVVGTTAYVAGGSAGLQMINISNPASPTLLGTYNTPGTATAVRVNDTTAYVADGTSIQVINVSNPALPTFITQYTTPWNYRDLEIQSVSGTLWGYIALDSGVEGMATINLNTGPKINQAKTAATTFVDFNGWDSSSDQLGFVSYSNSSTLDQTLTKTYSLIKSDINATVANGGTATGDGINTATSHLQSNQVDVSNSGGQNQLLTIGQSAASLTGGQSFQPVLPYLSRVDVSVRRIGSPTLPLTVEIRSTLSGSPIASTTIPVSAIGTAYALETATFSSPVPVTVGTTYYIVLSTTAINSSNFYHWAVQSTNPYSGGNAYQNTTSQSTWDARFVTYGQYSNPSALKFQILMTDGLTNAGANTTTAAINAANNGIVIYTIGFGKDADATELTNIATITGGKYYAALDQDALIDVYTLIAQTIQLIASDANVVAGIPNGTVLVSDGNGLFSGTDLVFDINTLNPQPWTSTYTFNIPCTSTLACSSTLLSIPSPGTKFEYIDSNGNPQAKDWNVFSTQTFSYRDLSVDIVSGSLLGVNNTDLTVNVQSLGNLDTNASSVSFYQGVPPTNLLTTVNVPSLCGQLVSGCTNYSYLFTQNVSAEGELYAVVNPDNTIPECTYNDQDLIYCYFTPANQFFTFEYWAWQRG